MSALPPSTGSMSSTFAKPQMKLMPCRAVQGAGAAAGAGGAAGGAGAGGAASSGA